MASAGTSRRNCHPPPDLPDRDVAIEFVVNRPSEVEAESINVVLAGQEADVLDEEVVSHIVIEVHQAPPLCIAVVIVVVSVVI